MTGDQKQMLRWTERKRPDRADLLCEWRERHLGVREAPHCCLGDRRLRRTELSFYPLWSSLSETTQRLRKDLGGIFFFNFLRVACGVVEWTDISRHYILFQLPIKPMTVKWLLVCTPWANCGRRLPLEWKAQIKLSNKTCFDSLPGQHALWVTVAWEWWWLLENMIVMCLDIKEDDTKPNSL